MKLLIRGLLMLIPMLGLSQSLVRAQEVTEDFTVVEPLDDIPPPPIGVEEIPPPLEIPVPEGMDGGLDAIDPSQSFGGWEDPGASGGMDMGGSGSGFSAVKEGPIVFRKTGKRLQDPSGESAQKLKQLKSLQKRLQSGEAP